MKIDQNVTVLNSGAARPASSGIKGSTPARGAAPMPASAVDHTRLATSTTLPSSPNGDFDAARVAEIRESISAGRYQINPSKIADGLISTVRDLLNQNPR